MKVGSGVTVAVSVTMPIVPPNPEFGMLQVEESNVYVMLFKTRLVSAKVINVVVLLVEIFPENAPVSEPEAVGGGAV